MGPKANAKSAAAVQERFREMGIEHVDEWDGWSRGDTCGIEDTAGVFVIQYFRKIDGVVANVAVVGGPVDGQRQVKEWRSFPPSWLSTTILQRGKNNNKRDT